jgi:hypothetical protein
MVLRLGNFKMPAVAMETTKTLNAERYKCPPNEQYKY